MRDGPDEDPHAVRSLRTEMDCDAATGRVRWDPLHSLWNGGMTLVAVALCPLTASPAAVGVFVISTAAVLLLGHSVGLHRRLIHRSFACPYWVEVVLVWFGTAVGMNGPLSMMRIHDTRDWAQRQVRCHDYLAHRRPPLIDAWWQLHCRLELERPPVFAPPPQIADDRIYRVLERSWMAQQLPIAVALYLLGGWGFVAWGVFARVAVCVTGHWLVGHLAHRTGPQTWLVDGAGVQAHNIPWAALPTMGEAWHNNHHAYPGSARMGLRAGEIDPGFAFIRLLERIGLAWDIRTPEALPSRPLRPAAGVLEVVR